MLIISIGFTPFLSSTYQINSTIFSIGELGNIGRNSSCGSNFYSPPSPRISVIV